MNPKQPSLMPMERTLRAPVERVWRRFTTKEGIESWWGPEGFRSVVNHVDVRVGGGFEIAMTAERPEIIAYLKSSGVPVTSYDRGTYTDVQLQQRLAWSGVVDFIPGVDSYGSDTVVELTSLPDGGTRLVVQLTAMHNAHWNSMKTMGWEGQLKKLEELLLGETP
jgi:uncharacterized protein YndB with AHSA1/START domain